MCCRRQERRSVLKYMAVPVFGGKVRRRNLSSDLYSAGTLFGYTMIVAESAIGRMTRKRVRSERFGHLARRNGCPLAAGSMRSYRC